MADVDVFFREADRVSLAGRGGALGGAGRWWWGGGVLNITSKNELEEGKTSVRLFYQWPLPSES